MKINLHLFYILVMMLLSFATYSQKYKTFEDTTKLNKEYVNVSNDLVELKAKLAVVQNNLPGYQTKAKEANSDAVVSASASSDQALKAKKRKYWRCEKS